MTVAVGVGVGTLAGVTIGLMLARGVDLLPGEGLGLLLGDGVLGVGRMFAVGGSERLELRDKDGSQSTHTSLVRITLNEKYDTKKNYGPRWLQYF